LLRRGTSLGTAFDPEHGQAPNSQQGDVASRFLDLQDRTALVPFDDSDLDNPEVLSAAAAEIYRMRRARDHVFPKCLTGEPAWDMLLALYSEEPARPTVSSICYGSGVPHSAALRWISTLERQGLVERVEHRRDGKVTLLTLTNEGRGIVQDTLKAMLRAFRS
jgi:DNA-binding MarR family transcriptional regulator